MLKSEQTEVIPLSEHLYITDELYTRWNTASRSVTMSDNVVSAIKALRKTLAIHEKEDENQLRYYISDRRWRKAYRLMQTSAYLNGRDEINLTDFLLLTHSFWNDVETIPNVLAAFTSSISEATVKQLNKIDKSIRQMMTTQNSRANPKPSAINTNSTEFAEYDYFYYLVENYPDGETYFSKWDYASLPTSPRDGVRYYDSKRKKNIIHTLIPGRPFDAKSQNASNLIKVTVQKCRNGAIIDGTPYYFKKKNQSAVFGEAIQSMPIYQRIAITQDIFQECVGQWENLVVTDWATRNNIFLSSTDLALMNRTIKEVGELIKTIEVKINNVVMMIK